MAYEEERVVETNAPADPTTPVERVVEPAPVEERVVRTPVEPTVVEHRPTTRVIRNDDPVGNAYAASQLIQTIVWSVVIIVLLVVLLLALHVYAHLF
ncbi:MAG: hypothetical protein ACRDFX_07210 [Chloroflexota bacterium]